MSQSITESERMKLLRLRAGRLEKGELCTVNSTSRSAYGDTLADVKSGYDRGCESIANLERYILKINAIYNNENKI